MLTYGYCRLSIHLGNFCSIIFFLWDSNIYICSKWEDSHYFWIPALTWMHLLEAALQLNPTKISVYLMIKYLWQWDNKCFETIAKLNLGRWAEECKAMQNKIRKKKNHFWHFQRTKMCTMALHIFHQWLLLGCRNYCLAAPWISLTPSGHHMYHRVSKVYTFSSSFNLLNSYFFLCSADC